MRKAIRIIGFLTAVFTGAQALAFDITPEKLKKMLEEREKGKEKFILLDVRTPREHAMGYIPGTDKLIPYDELERRHKELGVSKDTPIVVYCRSGRRAEIAKRTLKKLGYKNVFNAGGIKQWLQAGYKLEKPN